MTNEESKNIIKQTITEMNQSNHCQNINGLYARVIKLENNLDEIKNLVITYIESCSRIEKMKRDIQHDIEEWFINKYIPSKKKSIIERILSIFK